MNHGILVLFFIIFLGLGIDAAAFIKAIVLFLEIIAISSKKLIVFVLFFPVFIVKS